MAQTRPTSRTFPIASPAKAMIPAILACAFALGVVFVLLEPRDRWIILLLAVVMLLSLGLIVVLLGQTRLEVSPQGIVYYAPGYRVRSDWANIEGYAERVVGTQDVESLILREPGMELSRWMRIGYSLMPAASMAALVRGRVIMPGTLDRYQDIIPVGLFADDWRNSELGDLIKQYAPQAYANPMK